MAVKTIWCREKRTMLGKPNDKRWRCPDCKQRFIVCSRPTEGGEIAYWAPPHKKRAK